MNDKRADIHQIRKYLNGELNAGEMHRLEREAQDDPFLMDALEGYELANTSQKDNLAALQQRLQERAAPTTRRIIPWTVITVAASIIGFVAVVGLLYKNHQPAVNEKVAANQPVNMPLADSSSLLSGKNFFQDSANSSAPIAFKKPATVNQHLPAYARQTAANNPSSFDDVVAAAETKEVIKKSPDSPAMEDRIMGYMAAKRQDTVLGGDKVIVTTNNSSALTPLNSKAKGAELTPRPDKAGNNSPYVLSQAGLPSNLVTGIVLDHTNGEPIAGALIKVVGKPIVARTDVNGKFSLPNVKKDEDVSVGIIGYNNKTFAIKGSDSLKVELNASASALSEVVVTKRKVTSEKAHPRTGWANYKKYLKDNAVGATKSGTVQLAVIINANGSIGNICVIKTLSPDADAKSIELVKNGPQWIGNSNGSPEEVKIKVAF